MSKIDVIKLAEFFEKSSIAKLSYTVEDEKIVLEKYIPQAQQVLVSAQNPVMPQTAPQAPLNQEVNAPAASNESSAATAVKAPLVGVFYASKAPGEAPFVSVGDKVEKGQILCLIEAMKMMSEITSPVDGVIKAINFKNEDVVSFDDVLFEVI